MDRAEWTKVITKSCEDAGTYRPFFNDVIDTLAGIMEVRDEAQAQFEETGGRAVVKQPSSTGVIRDVKNPALVVLMDCNAQALAYWRDLGLTPAGYKRLNADVVKDEGQGNLETLLEKMMEDG